MPESKLSAAAPDLLEALRNVLFACPYCRNGAGHPEAGPSRRDCPDAKTHYPARAAIVKATF